MNRHMRYFSHLLMRFSSVARERMEFIEWSCNISQTEVPCGNSMACAQWIWNSQGLTVCPIESLLSVSHNEGLGMHREPSVSWKCSGFMLVRRWSLLWIGWNTLVCVRSLYGLVQTLTIDTSLWLLEISHKHQKLTWSSYLDFLFPPLCLEKSACMVTICLYCGYLQGNKHAWWSLHIVTFGFLFFTVFCICIFQYICIFQLKTLARCAFALF